MVTQRIEEIPDNYDIDPTGEGLDQDAIDEIVRNETQEAVGVEEGEGNVHTEQSSEEDIYSKAVEALTKPVEPDYIDRGYFETRLTQAINDIKTSVVDAVKPAEEPTQEEDFDVKAFEAVLRRGTENPDPREIEAAKQEYRQVKSQMQNQQTEAEVPQMIKFIYDKLQEPAVQTQNSGWTPDKVANVQNAIGYLATASGITFNLNDRNQVGAIIDGLDPNDAPDLQIQKINNNISQIKARMSGTSTPDTTNAAQVPSVGGVPTTQDTRVFSTREEILLAIEDGEIPIADYEKYVATL